jgi:hypothetical protein
MRVQLVVCRLCTCSTCGVMESAKILCLRRFKRSWSFPLVFLPPLWVWIGAGIQDLSRVSTNFVTIGAQTANGPVLLIATILTLPILSCGNSNHCSGPSKPEYSSWEDGSVSPVRTVLADVCSGTCRVFNTSDCTSNVENL